MGKAVVVKITLNSESDRLYTTLSQIAPRFAPEKLKNYELLFAKLILAKKSEEGKLIYIGGTCAKDQDITLIAQTAKFTAGEYFCFLELDYP